MKKKLYITIGVPGSGKSTWYTRMRGEHPYEFKRIPVVSSDAIRGELYGDENIQGNPDEVFKIAHQRVVDILCSTDYDGVVFDATNIKKKNRITFINEIKKRVSYRMKCDAVSPIAVWFAIPISVCKLRNSGRNRVVPEFVIDKMYRNFCPPAYEEGFDGIEIIMDNNNGTETYSAKKFLEIADAFDQHNPHHTLTLGGHCRKAMEYVKENNGSKILQYAALLHDNGKLPTASFANGKGELTETMHFYQHHCCGAYDIPFYAVNDGITKKDDIIYIANLIYYHMHPLLQWKSQKALEKDKKYMSETFYSDLMLLHDGDLNAH